jgi:CRP-like cAMP-binding protein
MTRSVLRALEEAPFFAGMGGEDLAAVAAHAEWVSYGPGQRIFGEGEAATRFLLLEDGLVDLSFREGQGGTQPSPLQTVRHRGQALGWSALVEPYAYRATATAVQPTRLLAMDRDVLERRAATHPDFGAALMRAVLGLVGDRLRATRFRLVARRYDDDVAAIRALLADSAAGLPVTSPLHKIPHYLQHRLTLDDAFHCLSLLQGSANAVERELAALIGDELDHVHLELAIYRLLEEIYDEVAAAAPQATPEEVRTRSVLGFRQLFTLVRHRVIGAELLPDRPGHVVVMNHLVNHPDNLLPNDFVLTLDTHFVSSMVLYEKYREAPIRVIRKSRPDEYGHQLFYDRLGYVYTYSGYVDPEPGRPAVPPEVRRRFFLDAAGLYLTLGKNVVICPEGTSTTTEQSPLRFRPGAFDLAAHVRPEPLVVPIAVAGFDRRLTRTTVVAVVHQPFRMSQQLPDPDNRPALLHWLNETLQPQFRTWVCEAAARTGESD